MIGWLTRRWERRLQMARVSIAQALLVEPSKRWFGWDLSREAGVSSGIVYPVLQRMLKEGLLVHGWETAEEAGRRPPRRWVQPSERGRDELWSCIVPEWS